MRVSSHDIDINGNARPSLVLRYMQEAANQQLYNIGPSNEQLREEGKAYVLCRVGVSNPLPLRAYDEIEASSWACESRLTSFIRCGSITRGGETAAELYSVWALVDINDHHLNRVDETVVNYDKDEPVELPFNVRFHIPKDIELSFAEHRHIGYADVDLNRHMNNTNYPDMLVNCIRDMNGRRVESFVINYIHEAPYGEKISIYTAEKDGDRFFRTVNEDGTTGVEARFTLTDC